ncbi:MAG: flagellar hook-length control protein FliK [Pseudomonadales bacterium]|nr:flagellar hook-length control protein FliK [Pseudomonadales bacterium]
MNTLLLSAVAMGTHGTPGRVESGETTESAPGKARAADFSDELKKQTSPRHDARHANANADESRSMASTTDEEENYGVNLPENGQILPPLEDGNPPDGGELSEIGRLVTEDRLLEDGKLVGNEQDLRIDQHATQGHEQRQRLMLDTSAETHSSQALNIRKADTLQNPMPVSMVNSTGVSNQNMSGLSPVVLGDDFAVSRRSAADSISDGLVRPPGIAVQDLTVAVTGKSDVASPMTNSFRSTSVDGLKAVRSDAQLIGSMAAQPEAELTNASTAVTKGMATFAGLNPAAISSPQSTPSTQPAVPTLPLASGAAFGTQGWSNAVANRVMWLTDNRMMTAELRLDPPDLGPLQVKITMNEGQAQVSFVSQSSDVRGAIDQSVARLRELFSERDVELVNVDISDHSSSESSARENPSDSTGNVNEMMGNRSFDESGDVELLESYQGSSQPSGMVDYYV